MYILYEKNGKQYTNNNSVLFQAKHETFEKGISNYQTNYKQFFVQDQFFCNSGRHKSLCNFFLKDSFQRNNSFPNHCRNKIVFDKRVCIKITLSGWYSENLMSTRGPGETCPCFERSHMYTKIITNVLECFTNRKYF